MKKPKSTTVLSGSDLNERWVGRLEGVHTGLLIGWALDRHHPDRRVVVEICINGEPLTCAVADIERSDLAGSFRTECTRKNPPNDHCHGFIFELGELELYRVGVLTARVANTEHILGLPIHLDMPVLPSSSAVSLVVNSGDLQLHGWAVDPAHPTELQTVRAFLGHVELASSLADGATTLRHFKAGVQQGFTLDLPLWLGNGQQHEIRVVNQSGVELNGSPLTICCYISGARTLLSDKKDPEIQTVLRLLSNYERLLPYGVGLQHYRQWADMFEVADHNAVPAVQQLKIGIIGWGDADAAMVKTTLQSLKSLSAGRIHIYGNSAKARKSQFEELLLAALAEGCELLACVRWGDTLVAHAFTRVLPVFETGHAQAAYSDSTTAGIPWFKPAWSPIYALGTDYPLELLVMRSTAAQAAIDTNGLPKTASELAWAVLSNLWSRGVESIWHIPEVLYHRSSAVSEFEVSDRYAAASKALQSVDPTATLALVADFPPGAPFQPRRVLHKLSNHDGNSSVTLIIPTRDRPELLERCIDSLRRYTQWRHLEIMVIDNDSAQASTLAFLRKIAKSGVTVLRIPGPFNFSALNNRAVESATGEIVGLVNNDVEALHSGWLDEMVLQLLKPGVGAVGAKLLWPNGMVQHGGVLLGPGHAAGHFGNHLHDSDWGDHGRNQVVHCVSAVTAACLLVRKSDYLSIGGLDEMAFPVAFNDVDFCLKLRQAGKTIVWTPHARLMHAESVSRGSDDTSQKKSRAQREVNALRKRWGEVLLKDPAYHPSLGLNTFSAPFESLAIPPRDRAPRNGCI